MVAYVDLHLRRWGSSLGAVIPKRVVETAKLRENDVVRIRLETPKSDPTAIIGLLKGRFQKTPQQVKDELRTEWE